MFHIFHEKNVNLHIFHFALFLYSVTKFISIYLVFSSFFMQIFGALLCFQKWKRWFSVSKMFILYIYSSSNIVTILKSKFVALFLFPNGNK